MRGTSWATIASRRAAVVTTWEVSSSGSDASSGMPGEVHDGVEPLLGEDRLDGVGVGAVGLVPGEGRAVGRRDQVEADHVVAGGRPGRW